MRYIILCLCRLVEILFGPNITPHEKPAEVAKIDYSGLGQYQAKSNTQVKKFGFVRNNHRKI
jgi:hypothetical protein